MPESKTQRWQHVQQGLNAVGCVGGLMRRVGPACIHRCLPAHATCSQRCAASTADVLRPRHACRPSTWRWETCPGGPSARPRRARGRPWSPMGSPHRQAPSSRRATLGSDCTLGCHSTWHPARRVAASGAAEAARGGARSTRAAGQSCAWCTPAVARSTPCFRRRHAQLCRSRPVLARPRPSPSTARPAQWPVWRPAHRRLPHQVHPSASDVAAHPSSLSWGRVRSPLAVPSLLAGVPKATGVILGWPEALDSSVTCSEGSGTAHQRAPACWLPHSQRPLLICQPVVAGLTAAQPTVWGLPTAAMEL